MITLPLRSERVPLVRVLVADRFNGGADWTLLPMLSQERGGFELLDNLTRAALPEIGECTLRIRFGVIDGMLTGLSAAAMASVQASGSWDADTDLVAVPSLIGKEIRVQLCPDDGELTWRTVWWGSCEYETDNEWPGATLPVGERICHCFDGLFRTKRWFMTQHAAYVNSDQYKACPGHPGYNIGHSGKTLGNRDNTGATWEPFPDSDSKFYMHAWQGTGGATVWTDLQAAEHALRVSRPQGEPQFNFSGTTALLSTGASPWEVEETDSAFDVISRICARERGRGLVFVDWVDDVADPTGSLTVRLAIMPQTYDDITYISNPITGATSTIPGALTAVTTVAVDLIGDHRAQVESFQRSSRAMGKFDAVETVGERIQALITASRYDDIIATPLSMEDRWSLDDNTAFVALNTEERIDEKWRAVCQQYGLSRTWAGLAADHNGGVTIPAHRVDYRCSDFGVVLVPTNAPSVPFPGYTAGTFQTSPLVVRILPDTPLLEGYIYSGSTPARRDAAAETGEPERRPPAILMRNAANRYDLLTGYTLEIKNDSLSIVGADDAEAGTRLIGNTSEDSFGSTYNTTQLGITLALELPHRLRFKTISTELPTGLGVRNVKRIEVPDAHLWLASPGAIWDLDGTTESEDGYSPQRGACRATVNAPGLLRDDRARVAVIHAMACEWYLKEHRPATWTIRCCGFLPSFGILTGDDAEIEPTSTQAYPTLGQLVTTLAANGQTVRINAPITGKVYNHQAQTSTWSCDWCDLDVR